MNQTALMKSKKICIYQIKPTLCTRVLQSRQGKFCGIQDLILVLNSFSVIEFLDFIGTNAHIFGPKNCSD